MYTSNKGFTLLELVAVIGILSILFFVGNLKTNNLGAYKERKEVREFKRDIAYARNRTILESVRYRVDINIKNNSYEIKKHKTIPETVKKKKFTSGLKLKSTSLSNNDIFFKYSGAPDSGGSIYLETSKGKQIRLTIIIATGKVNIHYD